MVACAVLFDKVVPPKDGTYAFQVVEVIETEKKTLYPSYLYKVPSSSIQFEELSPGRYIAMPRDDAFETLERKRKALDIKEILVYPAFHA